MAFSDQESPYSGGKFVAMLGAYGVSYFIGANLWLPMLLSIGAAFGAALAISRLTPKISEQLRFSLSLAIGQLFWMIVALLIQPELFAVVAPDLVIGFGIIGWCLTKPSKIAVVMLVLLQFASLIVNIMTAMKIGEWSSDMAAIAVHVVMRIASIIFALMALKSGLLNSAEIDSEVEEVFS